MTRPIALNDQVLRLIEKGKIKAGNVKTKDNLILSVDQVREGSFKYKEEKYPIFKKRIQKARSDLAKMI